MTLAHADGELPSWNDGQAKQAITSFVAKVTKAGTPDFVPVAERIAVFDNDGTLWAEQPLYFQFLFAIDRVKALSPKHPEWQDKEPFASLLRGDLKAALAGGEHAMVEIVAATHANLTTDEFESIVKNWLATAKHPKTVRLYTQMAYQPMLELLTYLRANGFKTFIVSGGGIEFMRAFADKTYGIPPEQVIGSSGKLQFELRDGKPVLVKLPQVDFIDDKDGKPVGYPEVPSAAVRAPRSAIPTATCRCCSGRPPAADRASHSTFITPTPSASGPTTVDLRSADSTRA
jgi:phosphoglycolate phosphatase-like HAD superfamily hydrolase